MFALSRYRCIKLPNLIEFDFTVKWATKFNGKPVAIINGFTFTQDGGKRGTEYYRCTFGSSCTARFVKLIGCLDIIKWNLLHSHNPPRIMVHDGVVFKI